MSFMRWAMLACSIVALPLALGAAKAPPDTFPTVPMAAGSKPGYAAFALDPWSNDVAYVMLDGSFKGGYRRAYVWSPTNPKYAKPVPLGTTDKDGHQFAGFGATGTSTQEMASINWIVSWAPAGGGGGNTYVDYVTGKTITVPKSENSYIQFYFTCSYNRGPRASAGKTGANVDLDCTGALGVLDHMTNWAVGFAPWTQLNIGMEVTPVYGKEKGVLQFAGKLYYGNSLCTVRSVPKDTKIYLTVSPYMEKAIHEKAHTYSEFFGDGVKVDAPYTWYYFSVELRSDSFYAAPRGDYAAYAYPFAPPAAPAAL